jgi:hypothetical protein
VRKVLWWKWTQTFVPYRFGRMDCKLERWSLMYHSGPPSAKLSSKAIFLCLQVIVCIYKVCNRRSSSSRSIPNLVLAKPCLVTLFLRISIFLVGLKLSQVRSSEMRTEEQEQGAYQHESAHHVHRSSKSPPKSDVVRVEHVFASRSLTAMKSQRSFRGPGRALSWAFSASFSLRV